MASKRTRTVRDNYARSLFSNNDPMGRAFAKEVAKIVEPFPSVPKFILYYFVFMERGSGEFKHLQQRINLAKRGKSISRRIVVEMAPFIKNKKLLSDMANHILRYDDTIEDADEVDAVIALILPERKLFYRAVKEKQRMGYAIQAFENHYEEEGEIELDSDVASIMYK